VNKHPQITLRISRRKTQTSHPLTQERKALQINNRASRTTLWNGWQMGKTVSILIWEWYKKQRE